MTGFRGPRGPDRHILIDGKEVPVRLRRSARARRLRLVVRPAEPLEVVLPKRATVADVEVLLDEKRGWIRDKLAWAMAVAERPALDLGRPGVVWLAERPIPVRLLDGDGRSTARLAGGGLLVTGPEPDAAVDRWYRREARSALGAAVEAEADRLGLRYRSISIRDPRTRWGSCSRAGALSFSWRLVVAPGPILAHVVIHELCHLLHHDHGPGFRLALRRAEPTWRDRERWLADHGHELHRYRPSIALVEFPP